MLIALAGLAALALVAAALYFFLKNGEMKGDISSLQKELGERDASHATELGKLRAELSRLDRIRHIPDILERAKKAERDIASRLEQAESRAAEIIQQAAREASNLRVEHIRESEANVARSREVREAAEAHANELLEEARKQAKQIASQARKEAKEKTQKADETLNHATGYALQIREKAEARAKEIGKQAYDSLKKHEFYVAAVRAMENVMSGYGGTYVVPAEHLLDDLADDYGFHRAGQKLKLARERTRIMEENGTAATCNYPEGWKRDYATNFVLSAFNGKVDSILARIKPANQGKLIQEIKDTYAMVNHNGEVFRNARIHEEYLDARLEELKWGVAVQRLKERERDEQRAIREQIREEERARKEYEKAMRQAQRDEELLAKALEKARQEYAAAATDDRAKYEAKIQEISERLKAAEEKNQRALSMAQQTKCGHVYVISNIGSFGEDVFKIGLTRRLEPLDRVRELGDASVPFGFDVHALIYSEDAPALEAALHRHFIQCQVNKVNRRKEFFRLKLHEIRALIEEMNCEAKWTLTAEARDYRETLEMERQMNADPDFRKRWTETQAALETPPQFDEDAPEAEDAEATLALADEL